MGIPVTPPTPLKLGVTFHSFNAEFASYVWSFEDLMYNATQLGGGVEIVGPVHHRAFPEVPEEFVTSFRNSVVRNDLTPTSYGSYADPFMRWDRAQSDDELVAYTIPQIVGAARLGFPVVRLQHFVAHVVERLLPVAEQMDVKLGYELHVPLDLDSERTQELTAQVRRLSSKYLGLIPDAGIFARSIPEYRLAHGLALGLRQEQVDSVVALWRARRPFADAERALADERVDARAIQWAHGLWGSCGHSAPAALAPIMDHVIHVHAKFFSMRDGEEPNIRYEELVGVLLDHRYHGWISSEYEGPPADSFAMVAQQQDMIRRYEAAYWAARHVSSA